MSAVQPAGHSLRHPDRRRRRRASSSCCAPASAPTSGASRRRVEDVRAEWAARGSTSRTDAWLAEDGRDARGLRVPARRRPARRRAPGRGGPRHRHAPARGGGAAGRGARHARAAPVHPRRRHAARACSCSTRAGGRCITTSACACRSSARPTAARRHRAAVRRRRRPEPVWRLVQGAYASLEGFLAQPLEAWRATTLGKPGWDPALWLVLHDREGTRRRRRWASAGRATRGSSHTLAVAERARGRGHGRDAAPAAARRVPRAPA